MAAAAAARRPSIVFVATAEALKRKKKSSQFSNAIEEIFVGINIIEKIMSRKARKLMAGIG